MEDVVEGEGWRGKGMRMEGGKREKKTIPVKLHVLFPVIFSRVNFSEWVSFYCTTCDYIRFHNNSWPHRIFHSFRK